MKNPALQDSPPAAGRASDIFYSAAVRSKAERFLFHGKFGGISYEIKNKEFCLRNSLFLWRQISAWPECILRSFFDL